MSREFAGNFYSSKPWRRCRMAYLKQVGGLCELCLKQGLYRPAEIVHHKIFLNAENIKDPSITMNFDNLQAVCREHHALIHDNQIFLPDNRSPRRYDITPDGTVVLKEPDNTRRNRRGDVIPEKI